MFSTIVVGTDGSEPANTAVAVAVELARNFGAVVHLVHVVKASPSGIPVTQVGSSIVVRGDAEMTREVQDAAHATLVRLPRPPTGRKSRCTSPAGPRPKF